MTSDKHRATVTRREILVLDGHDASGKTTLALRLAEALDGAYVRPFSSTAGELLLWSAETGDINFAAQLARKLLERALALNDASPLVFDRHWMTVFTLVPPSCWDEWQPLPATVLCWSDIETTVARLAQRVEPQQDRSKHLYYLRRYWALGQRFGCNILRTDRFSVEECLAYLLDWARPIVGK